MPKQDSLAALLVAAIERKADAAMQRLPPEERSRLAMLSKMAIHASTEAMDKTIREINEMVGSISWFSDRESLVSAGRFAITPEVLAATKGVRLDEASVESWAEAVVRTIRLPFQPTWIEYAAPGDDAATFGAVMEQISEPERTGLFIRCAFCADGDVGFFRHIFFIGRVGGRFGVVFLDSDRTRIVDVDPLQDEEAGMLLNASLIALRVIALMTARNAPVEICPPPNAAYIEQRNKKREGKGKTPIITCQPVRWSLSRFERQVGRPLSQAERAEAAAHMVRGHFKLRRSGVYWWRPHFRGVGSPPDGGRDHVVRA